MIGTLASALWRAPGAASLFPAGWSYGVRVEDGRRYLLFQVWDFDADGERYDLGFYFVEEDLHTRQVRTHVMRSRYYALSTDRLCELMRAAGFLQVRRIDDAFYQPVLVGTQPG